MSEKLDVKAKKEEEYAGMIEKFIATVMAPELLSYQGRITVLTVWALMLVCAIYGGTQVEINFAKEFFIPPDTEVEKFFLFDKEYFKTGFETDIQVFSEDEGLPSIDYTSEAVQL